MLLAEQKRLTEEVIRTDVLERKLSATVITLHTTSASLELKELAINDAREKIIGKYVRASIILS